jgi:hypothetical protein
MSLHRRLHFELGKCRVDWPDGVRRSTRSFWEASSFPQNPKSDTSWLPGQCRGSPCNGKRQTQQMHAIGLRLRAMQMAPLCALVFVLCFFGPFFARSIRKILTPLRSFPAFRSSIDTKDHNVTLTGYLPDIWHNFTSLDMLRLYNPYRLNYGTLPPSLVSTHPTITSLTCSTCSLTGKLPSQLSPNLKLLFVL